MVTIADVARRAKVTTATVSNVITQRVPVSEKTRARVLQAIEELGYRPNLVARGLAQGKTLTLALVVPLLPPRQRTGSRSSVPPEPGSRSCPEPVHAPPDWDDNPAPQSPGARAPASSHSPAPAG